MRLAGAIPTRYVAVESGESIAMREMKAGEVERQFGTLLKDVERGETIEISRDGKVIARMVPANADTLARSAARQAEIDEAIAAIKAIRGRSAGMTIDEILAARDEGRR